MYMPVYYHKCYKFRYALKFIQPFNDGLPYTQGTSDEASVILLTAHYMPIHMPILVPVQDEASILA